MNDKIISGKVITNGKDMLKDMGFLWKEMENKKMEKKLKKEIERLKKEVERIKKDKSL